MTKTKKFLITDYSQTPDFSRLEEEIADYWEREKIFDQSLEQTKNGEPYVFYDGPPFATGLPHYGHLIASTTKDVFPRYQTMRGRYVKRIWGWDCHGLPIENIIEKELDLNDRPAIMKYGVDNFCDACRSKVQLFADEWEKTIRRLGRFVDMEHAYKTMDLDFMNSEWEVFHELWEKGLVYKDYKVMYYCPRCATPLSNFEVTQGYQDVTDISVYVKFRLERPEDLNLDAPTFAIAWTTTPWTLPGNALLAIGKDITYEVVQVKKDDGARENYILAADKAAEVLGETKYQIIATLPGTELVGRRFEPPFPFFKNQENAFHIAEADFVTDDEGTGIVHVAPAYGEDDFLLGKREGVSVHHHVDTTGKFTSEVTDFAGMSVKSKDNPQTADIEIIKYLAHHDLLLAKKKIKHSYPHCWRCDSPLLNYATSSYFVKTTALKGKLIGNNQKINWVPEHFKDGRFGNWLENVRDWAISRNRYWGTPLPLWYSEDGDVLCIQNREMLEKYCAQKVNDLHKSTVDKLKIEHNGKIYTRTDEVFDCWFESGSMPYALGQFPADFISEGQDQTRGWFYTLHVLATALKGEPAFRNVLVNGIVLASDGKKMSKKLHNYPDPQDIFDKYGADALRLYLMTSPVMKAENLNFDEKDVARLRRQFVVIWWNCLVFWLQTGAKLERITGELPTEAHLLDQYLWQAVNELTDQVTADLDHYYIIDAGRKLIDFVDLLSTLYVRQSRERLKTDTVSQKVLGATLLRLSILAAPITPFISELVYQHLGGPAPSVHLETWPSNSLTHTSQKLNEKIAFVREVLTAGNAARKQIKIKNRQPLASVTIRTGDRDKLEYLQDEQVREIIRNELNVKRVNYERSDIPQLFIDFDQILTPELIAEGEARELMREIAKARKAEGLKPEDDWEYPVAQIPAGWQEEIERKTHTRLKLAT